MFYILCIRKKKKKMDIFKIKIREQLGGLLYLGEVNQCIKKKKEREKKNFDHKEVFPVPGSRYRGNWVNHCHVQASCVQQSSSH